METANLNQNELLELAKNSADSSLLSQLASEMNFMIRRAVARNINTPSNILSRLVKDPVLNVSYMASLHPNCSYLRNFSDTSHPCVKCEQDERTMRCTSCKKLSAYKIA